MEKPNLDIQRIPKKYTKLASYLVLGLFLGFATFSFYKLFNPSTDVAYERKVMEEIESVNVTFDKETIQEILNKNVSGGDIPVESAGKNPFIVY